MKAGVCVCVSGVRALFSAVVREDFLKVCVSFGCACVYLQCACVSSVCVCVLCVSASFLGFACVFSQVCVRLFFR